MDRPLPDDVARPARAYLAALVPADEVSDAWHELVADVAYWDDRQLLPVLRLAHQVVLQHARVTPEAAALVLVEAGIDQPEDVAAVLDSDVDSARTWTRAALATRDDASETLATVTTGRLAGAAVDTTHRPAPTEPVALHPVGDPPVETVETPADLPVESDAAAPAPAPEAVRIGFDEDDGPLPDLEGRSHRRPVRTVALLVVVLVALVVVLWVLAR